MPKRHRESAVDWKCRGCRWSTPARFPRSAFLTPSSDHFAPYEHDLKLRRHFYTRGGWRIVSLSLFLLRTTYFKNSLSLSLSLSLWDVVDGNFVVGQKQQKRGEFENIWCEAIESVLVKVVPVRFLVFWHVIFSRELRTEKRSLEDGSGESVVSSYEYIFQQQSDFISSKSHLFLSCRN